MATLLCNSVQSGSLIFGGGRGFTHFKLWTLTGSLKLNELNRSEFSLRIWQLVSKTQWTFFMRSCEITPHHVVITPPGSWPRHRAGSEIGAQTGWGPVGPRPGSAPHLHSLHGNAGSARRRHNSPCRHAMSPGRYWEGCWRCQTSAASGQAEWRNSAEEKRKLFLNNLRSLTSFCASL